MRLVNNIPFSFWLDITRTSTFGETSFSVVYLLYSMVYLNSSLRNSQSIRLGDFDSEYDIHDKLWEFAFKIAFSIRSF